MRLTHSEILEAIRILLVEPAPCDERVDRLLELAQQFKAYHTNLMIFDGPEPSGPATYCTLDQFLSNNYPQLSVVELNDVANLGIGESTSIGGGAAGMFAIKRVQ
jgi:hypothetical protein